MSQKIALGFGNNVDYEIAWDAAALERLVVQHGIRADELGVDGAINSERDLLVSILGFAQAGQGGERFVADSDLIERFARHFRREVSLGGTPVRAAAVLTKLNRTAALHLVTQNDEIRALLPVCCPWLCSNASDSHYPHLIAQFPRDTRIRANDIDFRAPSANRLIYHCNADNIVMRLHPDFADMLVDARALLASGFNAMQDESLLLARMDTLGDMLAQLPSDAIVFCEDGGFYNPRFRRLIQDSLGKRVDIWSMNEDEFQEQVGRRVSMNIGYEVLMALEALRRRIPARTLLLHTQDYAMALGGDAGMYADALRMGVNVATTRFCHGDHWGEAELRDMCSRHPSDKNAQFAEGISVSMADAVCVPVPHVEPQTPTTIGLGDAFVGGFMSAL